MAIADAIHGRVLFVMAQFLRVSISEHVAIQRRPSRGAGLEAGRRRAALKGCATIDVVNAF
jgi:hypothetical protein